MKIAIVGYGFVGRAMAKMFPDAVLYDPMLEGSSKEEVNKADVAFVCVPTPQSKDGQCDTSIVEETVQWLNTSLIIIRSTVAPGTTLRLIGDYDKPIVFMPEYVGETTAHPLLNESERSFLILGGFKPELDMAVRVFQEVYNSSVRILLLTPTEAEIVKYMENTAIASMVTLCNEFYNICEIFGADFHMVREGFLLDPRMSRYFTFVYPEARGFSGKCLPKDLNGIVHASTENGYSPEFIRDILKNNERMRG